MSRDSIEFYRLVFMSQSSEVPRSAIDWTRRSKSNTLDDSDLSQQVRATGGRTRYAENVEAGMSMRYDRYHLVLMTTHACNLRCAYCYTGDKFRRAMPREIGLAAIRRAACSLRPGGTLELGFFGGEPLLEAENVAATGYGPSYLERLS
jgi:sulfatase maturation enzyme AslB (radical SAM superfamily)